MTVRLDKLLASENFGSRKEVSRLVRQGCVTVNGRPETDASRRVDPEADTVRVNGRELFYREHVYIMMNKPTGVLSATEDSRQQTVLELLPEELRRRGLFPAGRLDKDTTGLLLLTDDGALAHRMLSPKNHVPKVYEARTARPVTPADKLAFAEGLRDAADQFAPAKLWTEHRDGEELACVELTEGKFHQVKRMFLAVGNEVLSLRRRSIGGLLLDEALAPGEVKELTKEEIERIFQRQIA